MRLLEDRNTLLEKKGLAVAEWEASIDIQINSTIEDHVRAAYELIYRHPYKGTTRSESQPREFHGIAHVSRVAFYITVFYGLYKSCELVETKLTDEEIKLVQIAGIFHDSAREGDGVDLWDRDSAELLYYYLTTVLSINPDKAAPFCEAIANKDYKPLNGYYRLVINNETCVIKWVLDSKYNLAPTIYQRLLHDADCLDIIRARPKFDPTYLHFYQLSAKNNPDGRRRMVKLMQEARSLIALQGDTYGNTDDTLKEAFDQPNCYDLIHTQLWTNQQFSCMRSPESPLHSANSNSKKDEVGILDQEIFILGDQKNNATKEVFQAYQNNQLYTRCLGVPFAQAKDAPTSAEIEIKKMLQQPDGNADRSTSLIGNGGGMFANAGFGIASPKVEDITTISLNDCDSGYGEKIHRKGKKPLSDQQYKEEISKLVDTYQMGGTVWQPDGRNEENYSYSEVCMNIHQADCVIFTRDNVLFNRRIQGSGKQYHKHTALLEAIYLREKYTEIVKEQASNTQNTQDNLSKTLPLQIFEYSATHNIFSHYNQLSENDLLTIWEEIIADFFIKNKKNLRLLLSEDYHHLEVMMLYGTDEFGHLSKTFHIKESITSMHSPALQKIIHNAIKEQQNQLREYYAAELFMNYQLTTPPEFWYQLRHNDGHAAFLCADLTTCKKLNVEQSFFIGINNFIDFNTITLDQISRYKSWLDSSTYDETKIKSSSLVALRQLHQFSILAREMHMDDVAESFHEKIKEILINTFVECRKSHHNSDSDTVDRYQLYMCMHNLAKIFEMDNDTAIKHEIKSTREELLPKINKISFRYLFSLNSKAKYWKDNDTEKLVESKIKEFNSIDEEEVQVMNYRYDDFLKYLTRKNNVSMDDIDQAKRLFLSIDQTKIAPTPLEFYGLEIARYYKKMFGLGLFKDMHVFKKLLDAIQIQPLRFITNDIRLLSQILSKAEDYNDQVNVLDNFFHDVLKNASTKDMLYFLVNSLQTPMRLCEKVAELCISKFEILVDPIKPKVNHAISYTIQITKNLLNINLYNDQNYRIMIILIANRAKIIQLTPADEIDVCTRFAIRIQGLTVDRQSAHSTTLSIDRPQSNTQVNIGALKGMMLFLCLASAVTSTALFICALMKIDSADNFDTDASVGQQHLLDSTKTTILRLFAGCNALFASGLSHGLGLIARDSVKTEDQNLFHRVY